MDMFSRVIDLLGQDNFEKLKKSSVAVFGVGGVGGYVVEGLVRSGIGRIAVIDNDTVSITNLNRQIIATNDTIGLSKVDVIEKRAKSINKDVIVEKYNLFYLPENSALVDLSSFDYIVDAVDTVTAKINLIERALQLNKKVISSMGTAGKLDPLKLKVCLIEETSVDPLARVMRNELKKRGIKAVKVVYSDEQLNNKHLGEELELKGNSGRTAPPSMVFVPAVAGMLIANEVIKDLIK